MVYDGFNGDLLQEGLCYTQVCCTQSPCSRPLLTHTSTGDIKWVLGSITTSKASGGDGISVELFQILKDHAVKVMHSLCQQIGKTQQWPQDWKLAFIPIPKKDNAKECSKYCTIALISHASRGFPGGSDGKVPACNAGDLGLIPGLGKSPGERNGNPLQYSCLENSMDRGAL